MFRTLEKMSVSTRRMISVLTALATTFVFLLPFGAPFDAPVPSDKLLHAVFFGVLAALAYYLADRDKSYLINCLGIVALGGVIELLQSQVPGREMSAHDLLANITGVALAAVFMYCVKGRKNPPGG